MGTKKILYEIERDKKKKKRIYKVLREKGGERELIANRWPNDLSEFGDYMPVGWGGI